MSQLEFGFQSTLLISFALLLLQIAIASEANDYVPLEWYLKCEIA